ncbi:hypothetical protein [Alteromonas mediterranea]|uniref:Uncharacterized protein n=1 Tax=Alteromonas mediterranea TaxID=314275 RepID=A0AAC9F751_9ALTE|nr:hypothetical protein [Alteromonas mediterranea]AGQ00741.1 hypothetical protein I636_04365 [Alteromonas mediterranea UM4b]AFV85512.1 hypothetical protein amad1_10025 [Alteromonas mediterranea DE1]AGP97525.1 hypothetical protein I635_10015 [Alteromonas mediterranea UM7]AMJ78578.1 hypothetical protein AV942_09900 [Alteromonas mediterranea]AMJ82728.1 hypothetical protein AV941_09935 [Alteromonas mediterranea]
MYLIYKKGLALIYGDLELSGSRPESVRALALKITVCLHYQLPQSQVIRVVICEDVNGEYT